ncbi:MAG: AAA family ATPase [Verrucomicrobiota bacterium]
MIPDFTPLIDRLQSGVLVPLKRAFVGKDDVVDLMSVCLIAGENLFILGPPGTAKSALVHELGKRLEGQTFEYLLTRFTEPNELFGPFDIRKLRDGVLETNIDGMLPEASLVFLDELLNANSAILNSLLSVLNERVLRRGRETLQLPVLMAVGASNHLPEDDALRALFDRFLLRVRSDNVGDDGLIDVLRAGWNLESRQNGGTASGQILSLDEINQLRSLIGQVDLSTVETQYVDLVVRLRTMGIQISDRRAVKVQRLIAASAILCGRTQAHPSDLWVLAHIWDIEEQRELLRSAVREILDANPADDATKVHPRAESPDLPNPDELLGELDRVIADAQPFLTSGENLPNAIADRLSAVENRTQWLANDEQRNFLTEKVADAWIQIQQT